MTKCDRCGKPIRNSMFQVTVRDVDDEIDGVLHERCYLNWIDDRREHEESIEKLCGSLNEENEAKLRAMNFDEQKAVVDAAFRDGVLKWEMQHDRRNCTAG